MGTSGQNRFVCEYEDSECAKVAGILLSHPSIFVYKVRFQREARNGGSVS
jgi:hypothetical protein